MPGNSDLRSEFPAPRRVPAYAVVVPMYDEVVGAEACVRAITAEIAGLPTPGTLIVVDDGSTDGTGDVLDRLHGDPGGFHLVHQANAGYGGALLAGVREAARLDIPYVLFMDSDLTNPPAHIGRFVALMDGRHDLIKGCRFSLGGGMAGVPWRRQVFSRLGNLLARLLFGVGIADCTNGFRAIRTGLFLRMPLTERGFAVIVEEFYWAKAMGATIVSVPTTLTSRSAEQRPTLFAYSPDTLLRYLRHAVNAAVRRNAGSGLGRGRNGR